MMTAAAPVIRSIIERGDVRVELLAQGSGPEVSPHLTVVLQAIVE